MLVITQDLLEDKHTDDVLNLERTAVSFFVKQMQTSCSMSVYESFRALDIFKGL